MDVKVTSMIDIAEPEVVEIRIRSDGKVIWVNVNGKCYLRICQIKHLDLEDERTIVCDEPIE
jgi:hypothetical protein